MAVIEITIGIKYSCNRCGLKKVGVDVPIREAGQNVIQWMNSVVGNGIKEDHHRRAPYCDATSVQDLMIPVTEGELIGTPTKN